MNREIIDYNIFSHNDFGKLSTLVQSAIKAGWQPMVGGFTTTNNGGVYCFSQAMVKYAPINNG